MNKSELVKVLAKESSMSSANAKNFIEIFCNTIKDTLRAGDKVTLADWGTFEVLKRKGFVSVNPKTKQTMQVPEINTPVFRPSDSFKKKVKA